MFFKKSPCSLLYYKYNLYLCSCILPNMAVMSFEQDGAAGWSTTYQKALLTLCFCTSKLPHSNTGQEHCRCNTTGCVYQTPQCAARPHASGTLYGHLYTLRWCLLCLFSSLAVVGHEVEQANVGTTFFICSSQERVNPFVLVLTDLNI